MVSSASGAAACATPVEGGDDTADAPKGWGLPGGRLLPPPQLPTAHQLEFERVKAQLLEGGAWGERRVRKLKAELLVQERHGLPYLEPPCR